MKKTINQIFDSMDTHKLIWLSFLIIFSLLIRFVAAYFLRDIYIDNEWKFLLSNLIQHQSYSMYTFDDQLIPSATLPPIYPFFLYFLNFINFFGEQGLVYLTIFVQIILSVYSIYVFYEINKNFFSHKISLINAFIFSIIPLNIYASGQISSITLQVIFSLLFLKFLILIIKKQNIKNIFIFSIISSFLILTRGEFILIFVLITLFILLSNKIKFYNFLKIMSIVLLLISPYLIRNYIHFDQVFIVKSLGYNLWKGNNELSTVDGFENIFSPEFKHIYSDINNLEKNKYYEINKDRIFLEEAVDNISQDKTRYFKLFIKKILSFYFIDINSKYQNYYNIFHILPMLMISILSFPGLFLFYEKDKFEKKPIYLYFFINLILFSIFFILARYKLTILPIQIIFASYFIAYIFKKLDKAN